VRDAHRRFGAVHVLTTRAARTEHVDAQVRGIDLDLYVVVDLGGHEHGCEGSVPAVARIEGRLAHEPMDPRLRAQPAVGVITDDMHARALDARDFAGRFLDDLGPEAVAFAPAQVHPQQHLRPVLRLGTARACAHVEKGAVRIHLAGEHAQELELLHFVRELKAVGFDGLERLLVVLIRREREELGGFAEVLTDALERVDDFAEARALAAELLRPCLILPDVRRLELGEDLRQALFLGIELKDTP